MGNYCARKAGEPIPEPQLHSRGGSGRKWLAARENARDTEAPHEKLAAFGRESLSYLCLT
jgi:hypothetical protein